jgi:hypothetical protein
MPEITAQRNGIKAWLAAGHSIDLFYSLHNTETNEYLEGPPANAFRPLAERFFAALKTTDFSPARELFSSADTTTEGKAGRMNVIQGLYRDFKIPGFLMEQRVAFNAKLGRLPLPEDRLRFGRQLVRAIHETVAANRD